MNDLHAYGMINGVFLSAAMYVLFFALLCFFQEKQKRISYPFFLIFIAAISYMLVNIFSQTIYSEIAYVYPKWLTIIAKNSLPMATFISTMVLLKNLSIKTYDAYALVDRNKPLIYFIFSLIFTSQMGLFIITNYKTAYFFSLLSVIPVLITAIILFSKSLQQRLSYYFILVFFCLLIMITFQIWVQLSSDQVLWSSQLFLMVHVVFSIILLVLSFLSIRFGYHEASRFFEIFDLDKQQLVNSLYQAIKEEQFFLVFQPKINILENKIVGVESLIRWQHPKKGIIFPVDFIPVAEKTNMINQICQWSIDNAVQQVKLFIDKGYYVPVSINFSVKSLNPDLVTFLQETIDKYQVPAEMIIIEITEKLLVNPKYYQEKALRMLRHMDIKLSLDDYGTGVSSLSFINKMGLHEIKIDKSFIHNIDKSKDNWIIVKSTIQMSKGLKLVAVAEGVENMLSLGILKDLGCDVAQGNSIAKPMRSSTMIDWAMARKEMLLPYRSK